MYNMSAYEKTEEMGNILFSPLFQYFHLISFHIHIHSYSFIFIYHIHISYFHLRISVLFSCYLCNWENNLSVRPI